VSLGVGRGLMTCIIAGLADFGQCLAAQVMEGPDGEPG
jgi:hypothetical protein